MNRRLKGFFKRSALSAIVLLWAVPLLPAAEDDADSTPIDRGEAYYHYTLGHLYHQLAGRFARSEYVDRAVKEYNAALEIDREADIIRNELIELYAGTNQLDKAVRVAEEIFERDPNNVEARKLLGAVYRRYAAGGRGRQVNPELIRKAIEQFEKVAEIEPGDIDNHLALGSLYRSAGEPEKAERALKRAIEIQPRHADAQVNLAYLQLESGNTEEAIAALESIVESAAVQNRHIGALAGAYEEAGRYRDAAEMYRKLVDAGGNQLQAMRRLAENLVYSRQYRAALDVYSQLTGLEPRNADHHLRISMIERERKNYAEAWASLDRARALEPDSVEIKFSGINLLESEKKLADAVLAVETLLEQTAKDEYTPSERRNRALFLEKLGLLNRRQDKFDKAEKAFRRIGEVDARSKPRALHQIVETRRVSRDFDGAEAQARKAVKEYPQDLTLANILATVLAERGKPEEGAAVLRKLLKGDRSDLDTHLAIAHIHEKGKQFDAAIDRIDKARALAESKRERINVLFTYGSVYERAKRYKKAEERFRQLLALDPENAGALNYLGYMFADRGVRLDEAHDLIQKALDIDPENGAYLDSLGWVYYRQGKLDLATKYLERSLTEYQKDPVVLTHLGDVYFKQGRVQEAKKHWSRSLEEWQRTAPADRDDEEMGKLRQKLAALEMPGASGGTEVSKKKDRNRKIRR